MHNVYNFDTKSNTEISLYRDQNCLPKRSHVSLYVVKHSQLSGVNREIRGKGGELLDSQYTVMFSKAISYFLTAVLTLFANSVNNVP